MPSGWSEAGRRSETGTSNMRRSPNLLVSRQHCLVFWRCVRTRRNPQRKSLRLRRPRLLGLGWSYGESSPNQPRDQLWRISGEVSQGLAREARRVKARQAGLGSAREARRVLASPGAAREAGRESGPFLYLDSTLASRHDEMISREGAMSDEAFEPDDCEAVLIENDTKVRITFARDNGTSREVVLPREALPELVALLVGKIERGPIVRIDQGSLRPGQTVAVRGLRVQKISDGSRLLTLTALLPDQGREVTIPLELSPDDARQLIEWLG
jgi:hypothetical protein